MAKEIDLEQGFSKDIQNLKFLSAVDSYLRYYATGRTHTARAKHLDLQHFVAFLVRYRSYSSAEKLKVKDWDFSSVQQFVDDALYKGASPATVSRRLATIKHMGRTLAEKIPGFVNPAREVKAPKLQVMKPQGLDKKELTRVKVKVAERTTAKSSFIRRRNQAIFDLLIETGLRADEIRQLRGQQLDEKLEWILNVRTKGRRYRNVYLTEKMRAKLKDYLKEREAELARHYPKVTVKISDSHPLFLSGYKAKANNPDSFLMGAKSLWRAINELSVDTKLHPHLLRHAYALDLLDHSRDVRMVAQALGHSDVRVTMRYTERSAEELAKVLESKSRQG